MSADMITPPPVTQPAPARKPRGRWLKRVLPLPVLLSVAVWFAPAVVAKTELRNYFARKALADLRGSVDVGGASLGWLAPVELRDVTVKDEAGNVIASVPKITSRKSLLGLARDHAAPGEFTLENPTVTLVCAKDGTNLEAALAKYLKDDGTASPDRVPVSIRVTGGTLALTDADTSHTTRVEGVAAEVHIPASRADAITAKLSAATGELGAEVSIGETSSAKITPTALAVDTFAPLLKRAGADVALAGDLSSDLRLTWGEDSLTASGKAGVKHLALSGEWLEGDTLRFDSAELPLDVELAGRVVRVRKFDLTCDVGTVSAAGTFDPDEPADTMFSRAGVSVNANVEVAKLAAKMPKLLRLKEGTELREGKLELALASRADAKGVVWEGKLHTSALRATRDGKPVNWDEPLHVEFAARHTSGELPTFDKFICTSDFIAVNARTTPDTLQAAANVYLHKLGARLAEFIDLGGVALDGEASAQLVGWREPDGTFAAGGQAELKNFAFTPGEGKGLKEPALKLQLNATGKLPNEGPIELKTATVALAAGGDELKLSLVDPVADAAKLANGSVDLRISGDVSRWRARVAAFVTIPAYQMGGSVVASGRAKLAADRVTVDRLAVNLTNVKFHGAGLTVNEPAMSAVADFTLNRATSAATFAKFTLNSAPLAVTDGTLAFEPQPSGVVVVSGNGQCVADLNRLGAVVRLYADPRSPDALHGRGVGPVRFRYTGDVTTFAGTLDVANFAYGVKEQPVWAEPKLKLEADGSYTDSTDAVAFAVAKADRPGLALDAKGGIGKVTTAQDVNVTGTLRYDWDKLTPVARDLLGGDFTATGTGSRAFAVNGRLGTPGAAVAAARGPSLLAAMSGEGAVGWHSLAVYGFDIGTGDLRGQMTKGVVTVTPLSATFGGGKVTLAPTLKLDTTPGEVSLAKGQVVERAKLTPKATAGALGYALPAIANATQAEGEISATIDENRIPLDDFTKASLKGTLVIHKATVGPGPVVTEIAKLLGAKNTVMTLANDAAVPVQVANGRVYHQNFAFKISGTTFHTSGSVGFDNTLDLVVDVPLPKDLPALKNNPILMSAVAGKVVKVPVKGTLTQPALDPKAFEAAVMGLVREGAKDAGRDLLEKELNKLFPGMPPPGGNPKPGGGLLPFPLPFGKKK